MKRAIALAFGILAALNGTMAQDRLLAGDLDNEENRIEIHKGEDGVIDFMKVTSYPGPGYMEQRSLDVVSDPWMRHGLGIVTKDRIRQTEGRSYTVTPESGIPAVVEVSGASIRLTLGAEEYLVTKPKDYLVEARPVGPDGRVDQTRRFAYSLAKDKPPEKAFTGIVDRSYEPRTDLLAGRTMDWQAVYYPRRATFSDGKIEAFVYKLAVKDSDSPAFSYSYHLTFSKDRNVNLRNFLIILTQRAANPGLLIHPVLLALLYFDALTE